MVSIGASSANSPGLLRQPLVMRKRRTSTAGGGVTDNGPIAFLFRRSNNPTFWIGAGMFCLVIAYVVIVIVVTRIHLKQQRHHMVPLVPTATTTTDNANKSFRQRLDEAKQQQQQKQPGTGNNNAKDDAKGKDDAKDALSSEHSSSFRQKHMKLGAAEVGVDPDPILVVPVADEKLQNSNEDFVGTYRNDPPLRDHPTPSNVLTAFLEESNFEDWNVKPLPIRSKATASKLRKVQYTRLNSCSKLTQQWPIDDSPVDEDPFLPWIHDAFPTPDGQFIQFVAQNKRRCRTGKRDPAEVQIMMNTQPQAALFQHVPVKRVNMTAVDNNSESDTQQHKVETRYKLVPYEQADTDGMTSRFVCRFKPFNLETLSVHNIDYDWTAFRKRYKVSFLKDDGGIKHIHVSQLNFKCPVPPELQEVVRNGSSVQNDWATLFVDLIPLRTPPRYGSPSQFLAPWYNEFQNTKKESDKEKKQSGKENKDSEEHDEVFDPLEEWGLDGHLLPRLDDSGRWENIPICMPSAMTFENERRNELNVPVEGGGSVAVSVQDAAAPPDIKKKEPNKRHKLVSCIWASAGYATRGNRFAINDGQRRLMEWITHNKLIGFDHFYLYDNSGAFDDDGTGVNLKGIADLFGPDDVTYIPWPAKVCNNNPNNVDSAGERSSQYAAESSCLLRFGPYVDYIGQFDIDEYLVPMGEHDTALSLIEKLEREDTRIVSFKSWRAWPRWAFIEEPVPIEDPHQCWNQGPCFDLRIPPQHTMLQAYNCDRQKPGQKSEAMPAEKQIYRSDYVTQHFVHYSAATALSALNKTEYKKQGFDWFRRAFPDKRQRFADELTEALMIHSKAVARQDTNQWEKVCHVDNLSKPKKERGLCRLGVPWPTNEERSALDPELQKANATAEGWAYNCYVNQKVEQLYVPQLQKALEERLKQLEKRNAAA